MIFRKPPLAIVVGFAVIAFLVVVVYIPTLQTIPNGSEHYTMIDVGETQIVLNVGGTLHATGYPLYVMLSSALAAVLRGLGVSAAAAPAVTSLIWGVIALGLIYVLAHRLTNSLLIGAAVTLLFALTRNIWLHHVIAEIYTFGLLILLLLYAIALWQPPIKHRLYWLALIGGIGVAHHRAIVMAIPALVFAVYPDLRDLWKVRRLPRALIICLLLGLLGFTQYAYLYIQGQSGAAWVYGEPGTLAGLWDQFTGREAARFIGAPDSLDGIIANFRLITDVLITDMTLIGMTVGVVGLVIGLSVERFRRAAIVFLLGGGAAYLFHGFFYTDILAALIIAVEVSLAFGWVFALVVLLRFVREKSNVIKLVAHGGVGIAVVGMAVTLGSAHLAFIDSLTRDWLGLETIEIAQRTPPDSTLMLAWGPRHFAVGFARDVMGELQNIDLVDHKADFADIIQNGRLITPEYTFYSFPTEFWEAQSGAPVYLRAAAPYLVEIASTPEIGEPREQLDVLSSELVCEEAFLLYVAWQNGEAQLQDQSVFVHLLNENGALLDQGDQAAPVYGWRPLSTWEANEIVRDVYILDRWAEAALIRYGFYESLPDGGFRNTLEREIAVECR